MSRPEPRQSAISKLNPIQPTPVSKPKKTVKTTQQVTVQINKEVIAHARGAYLQDMTTGQPLSFSKWVENALIEAIKKTTQTHGKQPRPIKTGILPRGTIPGTTQQTNNQLQ